MNGKMLKTKQIDQVLSQIQKLDYHSKMEVLEKLVKLIKAHEVNEKEASGSQYSLRGLPVNYADPFSETI